MRQEHWEGNATFSYGASSPATQTQNGTLTIQQIQSFRNLVTIEGLGQGKVTFDRYGSFQGSWAMGNRIFDVTGQAEGDRYYWKGTFKICGVDGSIASTGSFRAHKTQV